MEERATVADSDRESSLGPVGTTLRSWPDRSLPPPLSLLFLSLALVEREDRSWDAGDVTAILSQLRMSGER